MKTILISILFLIASQSKTEILNPNSKNSSQSKLSTDIKFDGHTVGGKTQSPFESLAEVENEKRIDDLIGVRQNFNDRIQKTKLLR